jgi:hypothetical protein
MQEYFLKKKEFLLLLVFVIIFVSLIFFNQKLKVIYDKFSLSLQNQQNNYLVAKINNLIISKEDLDLRTKQAYAYGFSKEQFTQTSALINIIQDFLEYAIALQYNVVPTQKDIDEFAQWVNKNTRAPAILAEVKKVYGGETDKYKILYLRPVLVNKSIRQYFWHNKSYHIKAWECMEKALSFLKQGYSFEKTYSLLKEKCEQINYQGVIFTAEAKDDLKENLELINNKWQKIPIDFMPSFLNNLEPNSFYQQIYDEDYGISIWYKVKKDNKGVWAYVLSYPKNNFEEWFRQEAQKVFICIADQNLWNDIKNRYSNLWWFSLVKEENNLNCTN